MYSFAQSAENHTPIAQLNSVKMIFSEGKIIVNMLHIFSVEYYDFYTNQ